MLMFGICHLSIVPCRREPSDASEMVTQLLFGDCFTILQKKGNWFKIQSDFDQYESWIDKKQCLLIEEAVFISLKNEAPTYASDLVQVVTSVSSGNVFPICIGSRLPMYSNNICFLGKEEYRVSGDAFYKPEQIDRPKIIETAFLYLNAPYLWGGKSPFGIDCSGFTQEVFKINGIKLPRDAYQQIEHGSVISFVEEANPGDLAFFENEEGKIIHVGILLSDNKIIHASGSVRIDKIDHHGIYNDSFKKYTHTLRVIKSLI